MEPEEATAVIRKLEALCCEGRLRELVVFSLEKRWFCRDTTVAFHYLKGLTRKLRLHRPFSKACCDRTKVDGFKLKE